MTTAQEVIVRALRLIEVASANRPATSAEINDGLETLNRVLMSYMGNGIGQPLSARRVKVSFQAENGGEYVTGPNALTATMPASPQNGSRVGFVTSALTILPNSETLAGGAGNVSLSAPARYFYRALTGWERERELALGDDVYLDPDMIDGFTAIVAVTMAPEYGAAISQSLAAGSVGGHEMIWRRFGQVGRNTTIPPLGIATPSKPAKESA
jgi:hypothetical protein